MQVDRDALIRGIVKGLVWERAALIADSDLLVRVAQVPFGRYSVRQLTRWADDPDQTPLFSWTLYSGGSGHQDCPDTFPTLAAAQAAAEADYRARIAAALDMDALVGLVGAAATFRRMPKSNDAGIELDVALARIGGRG